MNGLSPYWKEEGGISILADGFLGFVVDHSYMKAEPTGKYIDSYQIICSKGLDFIALAVRTKIRLVYQAGVWGTFFSPSYARRTMKSMYDKAVSIVMSIKQEVAGDAPMLSAMELSESVGREKHFLYAPIHSYGMDALIGNIDFSYAKCGGKEAYLLNSEDIIYAMSVARDSGFWPIVLPPVKHKEARFLSLPLGAVPGFLQGMRFYSESVRGGQ